MPEQIAKNLTREYWDKLLNDNFSLKGVGWPNWPESYNLIMYKKYLKGFDNVIRYMESAFDFKLNANLKIFEVGSGTGFYTTYFWKAKIKDFTGSDISETSINHLKGKFREYNFLRKDITEKDEFIIKNENSFDLICIVDVLLHITDEERFLKAVSNISSLLKPDGYLILGDAISVYRIKSHSEGSKYTHDISRNISYMNEVFEKNKLKLLKIFHRNNFFLNKNFDFKHPIFEILYKPYFFLLNGGLSFFRNNNFIGKLVGYPLSLFDSIVTPFQKYSKNSKFLLYKKNG